MAKFFTPYSGELRSSIARTGSKFSNEYAEVVNKDGELVIGKIGEKNTWAMTQEAREPDIYQLIQESAVDPIALHNQAVDIEELVDDFTSVPRTIAEAHDVMKRGERAFYDLPLEVRDEFNGSYRKMMRSIEDGTFNDRVLKYVPKKADSEVKDGESEK